MCLIRFVNVSFKVPSCHKCLCPLNCLIWTKLPCICPIFWHCTVFKFLFLQLFPLAYVYRTPLLGAWPPFTVTHSGAPIWMQQSPGSQALGSVWIRLWPGWARGQRRRTSLSLMSGVSWPLLGSWNRCQSREKHALMHFILLFYSAAFVVIVTGCGPLYMLCLIRWTHAIFQMRPTETPQTPTPSTVL